MTLKYESELLYDLMKRDGDDTPSDVLPYESELKEKYLNQVVGAYPKLQDYRPEWLNYNLYHHLPSDFPVETVANVSNATFQNVVPYAFGKALLKGSTKYRDIDTGEVLDVFEDGRNLELVSVKKPVLSATGKNLWDMNKIIKSDFELNKYQPSYYGKEFELKPNTTYTINPYLREEITNTSVWTVFNVVNNGKLLEVLNVNRTGSNNNNKLFKLTFQTGSTGKIGISIYSHRNAEESWLGNLPFNIQLEEGSMATSYEPYQSNILTANEDVTLRGIGEIYDELDLLTGQLTQRINEIVLDGTYPLQLHSSSNDTYAIFTFNTKNKIYGNNYASNWKTGTFTNSFLSTPTEERIGHYADLSTPNKMFIAILKSRLSSVNVDIMNEYLSNNPIAFAYPITESVKTVDLSCVNEDGETVNFMPIEGTMHVNASSQTLSPLLDMSVPVEATTQNLNSFANMREE